MVLIILFLPYFIISELRRANAADHCYFFYQDPTSLYVEKYFRLRTSDFGPPLLQYNNERPAVGVLEVTLSALAGLASSLLASCTNRKKKNWQPNCFKFEAHLGDVAYSSNPHPVAMEGDLAAVSFGHKFAFQVQQGVAPELFIKVYGCRTRKLTRGVKVKAVLGTAVFNLSELLTYSRSGHSSQSIPLLREGGREQARVDLSLQYRPSSDQQPSTRQEVIPLSLNQPQGLPVTGPGGAVWVAHPSLPDPQSGKGMTSTVAASEDEGETGEYKLALERGLTAPRNHVPRLPLRESYPELSLSGSGLESGVQVLSL